MMVWACDQRSQELVRASAARLSQPRTEHLQSSFALDPAAGLFSERQIVRPLSVALLITLAPYPTLMHFLEPEALPDWIGRYLGSGYCRFMLALFVASVLYAVLQYLGLQGERRQLLDPGSRSRLQDWIGFLSGRELSDAAGAPAALRQWNDWPQTREDAVHLSDYVLLVRGQQHQHNFDPIDFAIWVLPMLGFIGTVLGITQAIGGLADSVAVADLALILTLFALAASRQPTEGASQLPGPPEHRVALRRAAARALSALLALLFRARRSGGGLGSGGRGRGPGRRTRRLRGRDLAGALHLASRPPGDT